MKSKAPLAMMEQMVMVLVFALAAAVCLQAFLWSDSHSHQNAARDRACLEAQNAAELIKNAADTPDPFSAAASALHGSAEADRFFVEYDADWQPVPENGVYRLTAQRIPTDTPGLGKAEIQVSSLDGKDAVPLFQLNVAWQEVLSDG